MELSILQTGFEDAVRSKFGIEEDDLPNEELNSPFIKDIAEAKIMKRVPEWSTISDPKELLHLQSAVVSMICASITLSMPKRLNLKIAMTNLRLEKEKVDWIVLKEQFLAEVEEHLSEIESVAVGVAGGHIVGIIRNKRQPLGGGYQ